MDLTGTSLFVSQFRVRLPRLTPLLAWRTHSFSVSCSFGERFPVSLSRLKAVEVHSDSSKSNSHSASPKIGSSKLPELSFNRWQLSDHDSCGLHKRSFGKFVAREAVLDEEYWTAAWLRAEAHWESFSYIRNSDNFKRNYAEQEFYALKRKCFRQEGNSLKCFCLVVVKKEEKSARRTVLNSVVGTLDLSIRQYLQGETYPGELKKLSVVLANPEACNAHKYAYIANVCVPKFARRQGIASNMIHFAADVSSSAGMKQLFVHVNADNSAAQDLYRKTGFKTVEAASSPLSEDHRLLMSMEL